MRFKASREEKPRFDQSDDVSNSPEEIRQVSKGMTVEFLAIIKANFLAMTFCAVAQRHLLFELHQRLHQSPTIRFLIDMAHDQVDSNVTKIRRQTRATKAKSVVYF